MGADLGAKLGGEGWACDTDEAFLGIEGMSVFWGKGLVAGADPETRNWLTSYIVIYKWTETKLINRDYL